MRPPGAGGDPSPHTPAKITWSVLGQTGEIIYQATDIRPPGTWWPSLHPDICGLAVGNPQWYFGAPGGRGKKGGRGEITLTESRLGASIDWDQRPGWKDRGFPGILCNNSPRRRQLQSIPFYVCPEPRSRPKEQKNSLALSCTRSEYYCQAWGCETTGTGYWIRQPGWELITVKRNITTASGWPGWINPLNITFTLEGRKRSIIHEWKTGLWWGLRLYQTGTDEGVLFKIQLKEEPLQKPAPLGPGFIPPRLAILEAPPHREPTPRPPATPPSAATTTRRTVLEAPLTGPLALIQGSYGTLNLSFPDLTDDCLLCLSASPPYYEGIAFLGNYTNTTKQEDCSWEAHKKLTLPEVTGQGVCIGTVPDQWKANCNQTLATLPRGNYYLKPQTGGWWVCNTGIAPCLSGLAFNNSGEFCMLVQIVPRVLYYQAAAFEEEFDSPLHSPLRVKRELASLTLAVLLGVGVTAGVGTGASALALAPKYTEELRLAIDEDLKNIEQSITKLEESLSSLSEVVLQNRRGLDLLFLKEGGLCAALKEQCCFYADHSGLIKDSMAKLRERLETRRRERENTKGWFEQWFDKAPWLTTLLSSLLGPLVILLILLTIGPCIINRLITFVRDRVQSVHMLVLKQQYHLINDDTDL